jgi:hypothetical protein
VTEAEWLDCDRPERMLKHMRQISRRKEVLYEAAWYVLVPGGELKSGERVTQSEILRDVFGNPFRPVSFDRAWRTQDVACLAEAAFEERIPWGVHLHPHRLAVLADALEEVGADDDVVAHLRSPGPHVRGCWAVDLCLGKS